MHQTCGCYAMTKNREIGECDANFARNVRHRESYLSTARSVWLFNDEFWRREDWNKIDRALFDN